jgi:Flp pilus assembly protein TadG
MTRRQDSERGSVSVEVVVFVAPIMVLLTMFVLFCGRSASAAIDVNAAAAAAARAAAGALTPAAATAAAVRALAAAASATAWNCTPATDTSALHPGGQVTVRVTCSIPLADLGVPYWPATRSVQATATEPVDTYIATDQAHP